MQVEKSTACEQHEGQQTIAAVQQTTAAEQQTTAAEQQQTTAAAPEKGGDSAQKTATPLLPTGVKRKSRAGPACSKRGRQTTATRVGDGKPTIISDVRLRRAPSTRSTEADRLLLKAIDIPLPEIEDEEMEETLADVLKRTSVPSSPHKEGKAARRGRGAKTPTREEEQPAPPLENVVVPLSPKKAQRGRPVTTGKGVGIRERKAEEKRERDEREQLKLVAEVFRHINTGSIEAVRRGADPAELVPERDTADAVKAMSTTDLASGIGQCLAAVSLVGRKSGNLHGKLQGALNRAVDNLRLATSAMAVRLGASEGDQASSSTLVEEMRALREEIAILRAENLDLRRDVKRLEDRGQPPVAAPPPPRAASGQELAAEEWPPLEQRSNRKGKKGGSTTYTPPPRESAPLGEPMVFDDEDPRDTLPEEAPCPPELAAVYRPPVQGKSVPLADRIPGLQAADQGTYQLLTDQLQRKVSQRTGLTEDTTEWEEISQQMEGLLIRRAKLLGRHATVDIPVASPSARAPVPSRPPNPLPAPAASGITGGTDGGRRKKKKKGGKKKKEGGGKEGQAPPTDPPQPDRPADKAALKTQGQPAEAWTQVLGRKERKKGEQAGQPPPPSSKQTKAKGGQGKPQAQPQGSGSKGPKAATTAKEGGKVPPQPRKQIPGPGVPTTLPQGNVAKGAVPGKGGGKAPPTKPRLPRAPKSAAIAITTPANGGADFMAEARKRIPLAEIGIEGPLKVRKSMAGALILEVGGKEAGAKADRLAARLQELATEKGGETRVRRPIKMATLRIRDVEDSLTKEEIAQAIAGVGGCSGGEITVGNFSGAPRGSLTVTARCPLAAAIKVAAAEHIHLGWVRARVQLLDARPLICYKCFEKGHVRGQCRSSQDRSSCCIRCGNPGHRAKECTGQPSCPVCKEAGRPSGHLPGGPACHKAPSRKRGGGKGGSSQGKGKEAPSQTAAATEAGTSNAPAATGVGEPMAIDV